MFKKRAVVDIIAGNRLVSGQKVAIIEGSERGTALFHVPAKVKETFIIASIEWEEKGERSGGKAAGGAIGGALLAGPLGAIAGAAIGGRKRDASTAIITMKEIGSNAEYKLHVRCTAKDYGTVSEML